MGHKFKHKHKNKFKNENMATLEQVITQLNSLETRVMEEWATSQQRDKNTTKRIEVVKSDLDILTREWDKSWKIIKDDIKVLSDARQRQRNLNGDNQRKVEKIRQDLNEVMVNLNGTGKHDAGKPKSFFERLFNK